ncbi:DinB family protein [Alloacidobacterium sp.]|uniref:DinB family protein n=1 Tax=Alloacidobacterium sp. TaxID=2951999 RepID=UPI002D4956D8|nr:DinB family protein [Alloacidobacterium sp.]HYK37601.1 DinB family protein [Alloacidobacterium sp.]
MAFRELLLAEFDDEMKKTRKILERVPEEKFAWKPHEKSMALGRLASHTADIPGRAASIINTEIFVRPAGFVAFIAASSMELLERFTQASAEGRAAIESLREDQLPVVWTLKFGEKTLLELPRSTALRMVCLNHMIHHRAQLGVYLRLLDVQVPGMYGPSADDQH